MKNIYFTALDGMEELGRLYSEWSGKEYDEKYVLWNSYFMGARDRDKDDRLIGCVQLIVIDDPFFQRRWGLIENVFVLEDYRHNGICREMMRLTESQAQLFGCEFVKLTSGMDKKDAHRLYEGLGYKRGYSYKEML